MSPEQDGRLASELELLESMYPGQATYNAKGRELSYISQAGSLQLRLPDGYLQDSRPEIISASARKQDMRDQMKLRIQKYDVGEEVLDAIVNDFIDMVETAAPELATPAVDGVTDLSLAENKDEPPNATVIIWLHHLLNTNKRKLALHPAATVSGITKPGYPGVLIYSGPAQDVHEHVHELKAQKWQAFQPRLESQDEWAFRHGTGVIEVDAMKDIVADVGGERKDEFMEAMRMK